MIVPGPTNSLIDVEGLRVGHAEDHRARTGVTVVVPDVPVTCTVDVRGGAPGTINTDALQPDGLISEVHGLVLSGGSAFGLEAATGLMSALAADGRGFKDWGPVVPIVSGAILFDLLNGGEKGWGPLPPYRQLAELAYVTATREVAEGNVGAGLGAVAGMLKGGLGSASAFDQLTGITVAALVAVNSVGGVTFPGQPTFYAWHLEQEGELGGQPPPKVATGHRFETKRGIGDGLGESASALPPTNTTIGIVATDARLDKMALKRIAVMGHDGLAMAIRPIHSLLDGDTLFALSTGAVELAVGAAGLVRLGAIAADVVARATARAVFAADSLGEHQGYRALWGHALLGGER